MTFALGVPISTAAQESQRDFDSAVAQRFVTDCLDATGDTPPRGGEVIEVNAIPRSAKFSFYDFRPRRNDPRSSRVVYKLDPKGAVYLGRFTDGYPVGWDYMAGCTVFADSVNFEAVKRDVLALTASRGMADMAFLKRLSRLGDNRARSTIGSEGTAASGAQQDRLEKIFVLAGPDHGLEIIGEKISNRTMTLTSGKLGKIARKQAAIDWKQYLARQSETARHR